MLDFIRKPFLWEAWESGLHKEIDAPKAFHLKSIQDLAVYSRLRGLSRKSIAEVGGGDSRILPALAKRNSCVNIEKFQGEDGGPLAEKHIPGVRNVKVFLGEFSEALAANSFDVIFSVSVVEHVVDDKLDAFLQDGMRLLKPGGLWLHAIDFYLEDEPTTYFQKRFERYRDWLSSPALDPEGGVFQHSPRFTCDMASNPDDVMFAWGRSSPGLSKLRQSAQSVSLLLSGTKSAAAS